MFIFNVSYNMDMKDLPNVCTTSKDNIHSYLVCCNFRGLLHLIPTNKTCSCGL